MPATVIHTTISPDYCHTWGIKEALRELIQEGLDVKALYECESMIRYFDDIERFVIEDNGPGLPLSSLAMGNSSKRDNTETIGQFGEGLKLACLVLARFGRGVVIETVGRTLTPIIDIHPELQCETLTFVSTPNTRNEGTRIKVEVSREEAEEAMRLFLHLAPPEQYYVPVSSGRNRPATMDDEIFLPGGHIFVQGVLVSVPTLPSEDRLFFSYNFMAKEVQSRDRWAIDWNQLVSQIRGAWARCDNQYLIEQLIIAVKAENRCIELDSSAMPYYNDIYKAGTVEAWHSVVTDMLDGCVLVDPYDSDPSMIQIARELGYETVKVDYRLYNLFSTLGIKTMNAIKKELLTHRDIPVQHLEADKKYIFQQLRRIAKRYIFTPEEARKINIIPTEFGSEITLGMQTDNTIRISVGGLSNIADALETLIHEYAHYSSNAGDCTRDFEKRLTEIASNVVLKVATRRVS